MPNDESRLHERVCNKWVVSCPTEGDPVFTAWGIAKSAYTYREFPTWREAFDFAFERASK